MFQQEVIETAGKDIRHMKSGRLYCVTRIKHTKISGAWETYVTYVDRYQDYMGAAPMVEYERRANDFAGFELMKEV